MFVLVLAFAIKSACLFCTYRVTVMNAYEIQVYKNRRRFRHERSLDLGRPYNSSTTVKLNTHKEWSASFRVLTGWNDGIVSMKGRPTS